ncbi:MAG: enoyl-CoA hydratase/isomerase family protein [Pseudomonadota bacterium]|jgi:enoyl-CoA hydratase/carnithine racemase
MPLVTHSVDSKGIATVTLNDAANLNAMSEEMAREFSAAVSQLKASATAKLVLLTGAGRSFSAGGHLEMLEAKRSKSREENRAGMMSFYNSFLSILSLEVPVIAVLHGAAVGAGLCLACAADIRIAATTTKLGFTFLKLGLHPGMGGTFFVPRIVGRSVATELLITGRIISAEDGFRLGLVSKLSAPDDLMSDALSIANELLACGPIAQRQLLQTMRGDLTGLQSALEHEAEMQSINYNSAEFAEGIAAVREKRGPRF